MIEGDSPLSFRVALIFIAVLTPARHRIGREVLLPGWVNMHPRLVVKRALGWASLILSLQRNVGFWRMDDKIGMPLDEIHMSGNVPQCECFQ